ncbi:hypothetical protein ERJ75_000397600 [Trypanosoma vivax]|nr:hypothetical protein ERJ75_000397600 [Trypanosoma vivax]
MGGRLFSAMVRAVHDNEALQHVAPDEGHDELTCLSGLGDKLVWTKCRAAPRSAFQYSTDLQVASDMTESRLLRRTAVEAEDGEKGAWRIGQ